MAAQSKLTVAAVSCTCQEFSHPWTSSCACSAAGIMLALIPYCLRTYSAVYMIPLLLRGRIPTVEDIKRAIASTLQSTAYLSTNASFFILAICWLRRLLGNFNVVSAAWLPAFLSSVACLALERPQRRAPLALYVANVGTETLWNMMEARGLVRSIPNAQVLIMGLSVTALMYLYRRGLHKTVAKDATFKGLGWLMGHEVEGPLKKPPVPILPPSEPLTFNLRSISTYLKIYDLLRVLKHPSCPHKSGCAHHAALGFLKPFLGGVGVSVGLKLLLNIPKIVGMKMQWRKQIFNSGSLQLGLALGIFSSLFKTTSCGLRHVFKYDSASFALPAGLIGTIGLFRFPNTTVALYLMWKALQLLYRWGIAEGKLPEVPNFVMFMFAFFTAVLLHSSILEAKSIRSSYYKFIQASSGGRLSRFNVANVDHFGLNSYEQAKYVIEKLGIKNTSPLPSFPLVC
ncbi:hypothetical protein KR018_003101 [Drosophila ironensis]|nr:hypothetical protein KR018_003101 [Drosophila ironensis]